MSILALSHARIKGVHIIGACLLAGMLAGAAAAMVNPLILIGLGVAVPVVLWVTGDIDHALFALIGVIAVLPRFTVPVKIGITPTFLDLALIGLLAAWLLHQAGLRRDRPLRRASITWPALALVAAAVITFIIGLPNGSLTALVLRRFTELVLSVLMALVIIAVVPTLDAQERLVRWALMLGAASALIGILLYVTPSEIAIRLLSALRPFGYPTGPDVLRFILDDPSLMKRATGLWIDPNAFGGFLLVTGALGLPQLFSPQPVLRRGWVVVCLALVGLALVLTVSRGAMLGLAVVAVMMGLVRYRRALVLCLVIFGLIMILPQTRALVTHFAEGFGGRDLATQMRFGEYKDALRLIQRYPLFGVGFTGSPDIDLYVGVSSMYLLIAQQMGLIGLAAFMSVIVALLFGAVHVWWRVRRSERHSAIFLGAHGAVLGALLSGIFDHYFFNIDFHNSVMLLWIMIALAAAQAIAAQTNPAGQVASDPG